MSGAGRAPKRGAMRPSRFTGAQIKRSLSQVRAGTPLVSMCRTLGITQTTFYRWRKKYGDTRATDARAFHLLEDENHKLKQLVADLYLEQQVLRESLTKQMKAARQARAD